MLIKCSECGKEISDKAQCCPFCGCPIEQMDFSNYCSINGVSYDFNEILELALNVGEKPTDVYPLAVAGAIRRSTQLDWDASKELADILIQTKTVPKQFDGKIQPRHNDVEEPNKPKCPTCGSTNLKKISTTAKVTNTALFGIFGTKRHKTFYCNNCGYEW